MLLVVKTNQRLYPPPTLEELTAELRRRIAANRKGGGRVEPRRLENTREGLRADARELERLVAWIEGRGLTFDARPVLRDGL